MRYQYGLAILKGYPVAFLLVALTLFGFNIHISDLAEIFVFSLLYALPTGLISFALGFYLFNFLLQHFKASYLINVLAAGLLTSVIVGFVAGFAFLLVIKGTILGGNFSLALFFTIPTLIAGMTSSVFYWYSTR